jgi:hypothetical protein
VVCIPHPRSGGGGQGGRRREAWVWSGGTSECASAVFEASPRRFVPRHERVDVGDSERYHEPMPDVLIRDVPAEDLARIDAHAARQGLSRTEYLRRRLRQDAARRVGPVTVADLRRFSSRFEDLSDADIMRGAWS